MGKSELIEKQHCYLKALAHSLTSPPGWRIRRAVLHVIRDTCRFELSLHQRRSERRPRQTVSRALVLRRSTVR